MDTAELLAIQPADYLSKGFFDNYGEMREGINGYYSMAMAYRLREERADPDQLDEFFDRLQLIASKPTVDENISLDFETLHEVKRVLKTCRSLTIGAIFDAAYPWLRNWKALAALNLHLERILAQFVLIRSVPKRL